MLKAFLSKVLKKKKDASFEQFQKHDGGYLYKTSDGDYMLIGKSDEGNKKDN
ncbi:hypothetical protein JMA_40530 (plasmid) [Jeotgalibacillus malaysiensis]|uniref:Uncharacterized protein n=1 Tax=Jeotgalibacillus malaysiensis TaxID=1508404 RepID=A0A0B5ATF7_9BACL|nr:hypothetical protein [Jeotgalibacillus malaysiensis]AJD93371.1 hypothetical protein JMA_40530 [Jeotgalibacillus malaysiensis]